MFQIVAIRVVTANSKYDLIRRYFIACVFSAHINIIEIVNSVPRLVRECETYRSAHLDFHLVSEEMRTKLDAS